MYTAPTSLSGRLVVGAQHRAAAERRRGKASLRRRSAASSLSSVPMRARLPGSRNGQPFERRVIPDVVRRFAVGDLPHELALVQIDRGDPAVRRLHQRQPLDAQRPPPSPPAAAARPAPSPAPRHPMSMSDSSRALAARGRAAVIIGSPSRRTASACLGIERAALPVGAAGRRGHHQRRERTAGTLTTGGVNMRTELVAATRPSPPRPSTPA